MEQAFFDYQPKYYPVVLHFGNDASKDAYIRLKGDSSWREAVLYDGANGKMQFVVAFDQIDSAATFHGVGKLVFDPDTAEQWANRPRARAENAAVILEEAIRG